jgi:tetratricopeptide (TPR) repeat protein
MTAKLIPFPWRERRLPPEEGWLAAERVLAMPISKRAERARELHVDDPDVLLCICEVLRSRDETNPSSVRDDAEFFYDFLDQPKRRIGLYDEREYFLGEFALIAGTASRVLFRRDEARRWFDRSEASFVLVANTQAHVARLAYQRLALAAEERRFDEVLELAPRWSEGFTRLDMPEDALKCRFLEGAAFWEIGQARKAVEIYREICGKAEALRSIRLLAQAANNLVHFYSSLGEPEEALNYSRKALPLLKQLDSRVHLAKLQWSIGDLLRVQGKPVDAGEAYRAALHESEGLGMRGDVAAIHLVIADLLLDNDQERQAEWEIRAALPIIDEEQMVPEGVAALSLLRESLRRRQIDRQALRNLHGYFQDAQS